MKCISLWQPWASMVVLGTKKIETRSWCTGYRGPLLIHAAKRKVKSEIESYAYYDGFADALKDVPGISTREKILNLPYGAILGYVNLVACYPAERFTEKELEIEGGLGNFAPGRFGWVLEGAHRFQHHIEYKGQQGFFDVPEIIEGNI